MVKLPEFASGAIMKVAAMAKPIAFQLKKHAPEILTGAGAASVLGGTVLACKATVKASSIASEPVEVVHEFDSVDGDEVVRIHDEDAEHRLALKKGFDIVKAYLPASGLVAGGIVMMAAAKSIEHRRFTAALGAYSALQASFEEYRARVIEQGGEEMDRQLLNGVEKVKVEFEEDQGDGKKPKKVKEEITVFTRGEDPYHRIFDECNSPGEWRENLETNRFFLECQQTVLNQELKAYGRIFLNDVYKRLGFDYCEVGQFVGWLADDIEGAKDGYIDFGIDYAAIADEIDRAQRENRRPEPSLWLNFNCDGEVWDKPLVKRYDI